MTCHESPEEMTTKTTRKSDRDIKSDKLSVLIIGDAPATSQDPLLRPAPNRVFRPFGALKVTDIQDLDVDVVISALFEDGFDCMEIAHLLVHAGFQGRYRVYSAPLPRPELVKNEVSAAFPSLDFDIIFVATDASRAALTSDQ